MKKNKKIILDKLDKLKNGIENDFPTTLGNQQPLWEENYNKYVSKDKIEEILKDINEDIRIADLKRTNATRTADMEEAYKVKYPAEVVKQRLQKLLME